MTVAPGGRRDVGAGGDDPRSRDDDDRVRDDRSGLDVEHSRGAHDGRRGRAILCRRGAGKNQVRDESNSEPHCERSPVGAVGAQQSRPERTGATVAARLARRGSAP